MSEKKPWGMELNAFCLLLHLSQLTWFVIPFAGIILPVVMWATNKDDFPLIDEHGRNVLNWSLSLFIYIIFGLLLVFVYVGIVVLFTLALLQIAFAIIAAVKANDGIVWRYPLSITFFKPNVSQ